jgi:hypothetical protein
MVKHNNQLPKNHFVRILLVHTEGINADNIAQGLAEASQDLGKSNLDYVSRCMISRCMMDIGSRIFGGIVLDTRDTGGLWRTALTTSSTSPVRRSQDE